MVYKCKTLKEERIDMKHFLVIGNVVICALLTVFIAFFFASGTIGENYTGKTYVAPEFFIILPVWVIGASLVVWYFLKHKIRDTSYIKILLINLLLWATIPVGVMVSSSFIK
jgi:hypothetical protein